ncbi:hypothetical protein EDO6_05561 [Paenibacillus xylanexedens]|nr:hypothetical protein EDO6_05561 [Paenibacillus xylanexedens]
MRYNWLKYDPFGNQRVSQYIPLNMLLSQGENRLAASFKL